MSEHLIRLRGGWELDNLEDPSSIRVRLSLPVRWDSGSPRRMILRRRFGRPPAHASSQSVRLRLECVEGLKEIRLNGAQLVLEGSELGPLEFELKELLPRNDLELLVDLNGDTRNDWGFVALVILEASAS